MENCFVETTILEVHATLVVLGTKRVIRTWTIGEAWLRHERYQGIIVPMDKRGKENQGYTKEKLWF